MYWLIVCPVLKPLCRMFSSIPFSFLAVEVLQSQDCIVFLCPTVLSGYQQWCWLLAPTRPPLSSVRQFAPTLDRPIGQDRDPVILLDPARLTTHPLEPAPCQDDVMANTISSLVREGGNICI